MFIREKTGKMEEQQSIKEKELKPDWKRWLNYQSVVKQVPFFLFLALLAVTYIYNGHYADKTIRKVSATAKEVKELQYEYKTVKSEVMRRGKQSELVNAVKKLGLKEVTSSPAILREEAGAKAGEE
jgi:cell division protein FtsL